MSLIFSRQLTDDEVKILSNDLLSIEDWINDAIDGKLAACKSRLATQYKDKLVADGATTVPATDDALAADAIADPDYKTRAELEAEKDK